jgi:tetratricopeptide (TPR) repeat protein
VRLVALAALWAALALGPRPAHGDSVRDGDRALRAGRLEEALRSYERAAAAGVAAGQAGAGRVWLRRGRLENALEAFRRAEAMDPNLAVAHYGRGEVLRRQGKCAEAIPFFARATELDRRFPEAQLGLGNCLVALGQYDRGIAVLDRGLRGGRQWRPRFLAARGAAWAAQDSLRAAGIDFTRAREEAPRDPAIRKAVGEFYMGRGTWALAVPELRVAVALDSTDAEARYLLARALFYEERYDEALVEYRQLRARAPDYAPGLLGLGDLLHRAGAADPRRYAEARGPLQDYVRLEPADPRGWSLLGRTLYRLGARDSALEVMRRAGELGDTSDDLYSTLARAHAERREWDQALASFERGRPRPREYPLLAQVYEVTGQPARADSVYGLILGADTTSATAAFAFGQRAEFRFREKDFAAADSLFGRALALDPGNGEAWFYRGLTRKEQGREPEALEALRRAAAIDTTNADRFFWLGALADGQGHAAEARQAFRRSLAIDSTGALAATCYRQLGYGHLLKKQWKAAIPLLERAVALAPQDAQAWLWLAQGSQNAGDRKRAAECYRRVIALEAGNPEARKGLKTLGAGGGE